MNKRMERVGEIEFNVSPPEFIILWKLEYYRAGGSEKHLKDIQSILDHIGKLNDEEWLLEQVRAQRLNVEWQAVEKNLYEYEQLP